ncbi:MAG: hypothetical protein ACYS5V_06585, partial [Planctomycetota bacterium]
MAINPSDPALVWACTLDESGALSTRKNSGSAGVAYDIVPKQSSGTDGIPPVDDGLGGRALDMFVTRTGWSTAYRRCEQDTSVLGGVNLCMPTLPKTVATDDFAFGARFKWDASNTGGGANEHENVVGLWAADRTWTAWAIDVIPDDATTPTAARLRISVGGFVDLVSTTGSYDLTGTPDSHYIQPDVWYRVLVRVYFDTSGYRTKIYLNQESDGSLFTFTYNGGAQSGDYALPNEAMVMAAPGYAATLNPLPLGGYVDEPWLYDAPLSDDDATSIVVEGINIPWAAPDYEVLGNKVRVAWTNERTAFPPTRPLPTNATAVDHPAGSYGTRPRLRYEGFEPNRPWSVRLIEMLWDASGRKRGKAGNRFTWDNFDAGLIRVPGQLPTGALAEVRNMEFSGNGMRRRRGFDVIRDGDSTNDARGVNRFFSFRSTADELFRLSKVMDTLYKDVGGKDMVAISTGWAIGSLPSYVHFLDRCAILTAGKRSIWNGTAESDFDGEAAPTGGSISKTTGTLAGFHAYAYTFYDPLSGDETAPFELGGHTLATEGTLISSMDVSPTDARFTHHRIYRTVSGGAAPDYLLTAQQNLATTYTDNGDSNGLIEIDHVNAVYTTLVPPENFEFGIKHAGRCFYAGGVNGDRVYRSEANTMNRFQADAYTAHDGPVRALASRGSQLVVLTDRTIELVESDWIRNSNGATFEQITVASNTVGCPGHACVVDADDEIVWLDRRGCYRLDADKVVEITPLLRNIFKRLNWGIGSTFCGGWDHITGQVWWCVASDEFQDDNSQRATQLVWQRGTPKWTLYDLDATACGQYDDDLDGQKFGIIDAAGLWKEMEGPDSDGIGDGQTVAAKHTGTLTAVSGS